MSPEPSHTPLSAPATALTLLLSQADLPKNWHARLWPSFPPVTSVHLFLLDQATQLLHADFSLLPTGKRVFCAHSHRLLAAPPPTATSFVAGGLANLGELLRDSHWTLSWPHTHWPRQPGTPGAKNVGIFLGETVQSQKEAIRLAAGMAGCRHAVTLYTPLTPTQLQEQFADLAPLLAAMVAMRVHFQITETNQTRSQDALLAQHSVLLQL